MARFGSARLFLAAAALATTGATVPAAADHCNGDVTQVDTPAGATFYIDNRGGDPPDFPVPWIYLESNGEPGLQSGGVGPLTQDDCTHENPDTLIF